MNLLPKRKRWDTRLVDHALKMNDEVRDAGLPEWALLTLMFPFVVALVITFFLIIGTLYTIRYLHAVLAAVVIGYVLFAITFMIV
jgi:hypothetical protein